MVAFSTLNRPVWALPGSASRVRRQPRAATTTTFASAARRRAAPLGRPLGTTTWPAIPVQLRGITAAARSKRGSSLKVQASVDVEFSLPHEVEFGESCRLVGSVEAMGNWNPDNAGEMGWSDGHIWRLTLSMEPGTEFEFKCVKMHDGGASWEDGNNRELKIPDGASKVRVELRWGQTDDMNVLLDNEATEASMDEDMQIQASFEENKAQAAQTATANASSSITGTGKLEHERWAGKGVQFMRSNQHSGDRSGTWDTEGLEGAALAIVEGDSKSASWLQKLQNVKKLLVDDAPEGRPELDALVNASAYLLWINTGAIECVEGGGHYRPNRHAELSQTIFRSLEWVLGDPKRSLAEKLVARRIHPRLPSFSAEFTSSVPLTRIRDIAHRNDIPHDLKQEIKHTLQNKLHRNAGPEDLIATEAMLNRVTANPGEYSDAFVHEFKVFYAELKDFFNAGTLTDMLFDLNVSLDPQNQAVVQNFLNAKGKVDNGDASLQDIMEALHCLTTLRAMLMSGLASGLRNDAPDSALSMRQTWRLCEIRAEEYAFVLLSSMENALEAGGGYHALAEARDRDWALPIGATVLGLRHMGLSGWNPSECIALENELAAWQRQGMFTDKEPALRLKGTLDRCLRLTAEYANLLLEVYPARVNALGGALGVEDYLMSVYTESEIRAGVVFQLSKLTTLLARAARVAGGAGAWDVVVGGHAEGELMAVDAFDPAILESLQKDTILLVKHATGDEEVSGAGRLKGVVLEMEIPHLSHLGVRARQERVVFVTSEQQETLAGLRRFVGRKVSLYAGAEGAQVELLEEGGAKGKVPAKAAAAEQEVARGVKMKKEVVPSSKDEVVTFSFSEDAAGEMERLHEQEEAAVAEFTASNNGSGNGSAGGSPSVEAGATVLSSVQEAIALEAAEVGRCGSKAASCRRLAEVGAAHGFLAPAGACIPFGVMQVALQEAGKKSHFDELIGSLEETPLAELEPLCKELMELVSGTPPSAKLVSAIAALLPADSATIARSSANVEDLEGMSGAGLYDSIPNKGPSNPDDFGAAVAKVWASLYTRRAVLARRSAGVKQAEAQMSVLVMPLLVPEMSFVLHTVRPVDKDPNILYAEIAPGQGEVLASGGQGSPWRMLVDRTSGEVHTVAFANFSMSMQVRNGQLEQETVNYANEALSNDADRRSELGRQLMKVGVALEKEFGCPQDIEGAVVDGQLYVVQSRPQPL